MIEELLSKEVNVKMEEIDFHKCRFMGNLVTYNVILEDKDFCYKKSVLHKVYGGSSVLPIDKNGNASIREVWQAHLSQGTEGYRPYTNMGDSKISNFKVTDDSGTTYDVVSNWNVNGSFGNKAVFINNSSGHRSTVDQGIFLNCRTTGKGYNLFNRNTKRNL